MKKTQSSLLFFSSVEWILLGLSSILIAIWPMRDTIAARNILLVLCTLISFFYLYKNFRVLVWNQKQSIKSWMPIILVALLFIWVLIHYFFFSRDPVAQLKELTSTWARSLMASVIGFTLGLIIKRQEKGFAFILCALISGFIVLFCHYIFLVIGSGNFFQSLLWNSIYWGKINEVLYGTIILGSIFALLENLIFSDALYSKVKTRYKYIGLCILGILFIIHCYVFEIDSRNGVGIAAILFFLFAIKISSRIVFRSRYLSRKAQLEIFTIFGVLLCVVFFFGKYQHSRNYAGWYTLMEDVAVSANVDYSSNWQKIPSNPVFTPQGRQIPSSTYERVTWIFVGLETIKKNPMGYGLVHNAFGRLVKIDYPKSDLTLSHSGWLDLGLSFGVIGLLLILCSLLWTLVLGFIENSNRSNVVFWCSLAIFLSFSLLEIFYYHGVEILIFWIILLSSAILKTKADNAFRKILI